MRYLSLVPLAVFSIALQAQTANSPGAADAASQTNVQTDAQTNATAAARASAQARQAAISSAYAVNVSAELTKRIDTKNAKVGDEVNAKTTSTANLADGTNLPKGTRLVGKVTDVRAKSSADKTSHLAFALDRAVLRDGREIPVRAVLTSVTGPAMASTSAADDMAMSSSTAGGGMAGGGMAGGGAPGGIAGAGAPAGGGALGGAGRTVGGVPGGAANGAANTVGNAGRTLDSTTETATEAAMDRTRAVDSLAGRAGSSASLDHAPVANLPGVTLSSAGSASTSGSLDAANKNINLESGTKLTLNVVAGQH
ncbi:MAG: hypothetical protein JWP98_428 [Edaphobacter sp.]|nr:hypothetical protein [Edaphobacter sp.]